MTGADLKKKLTRWLEQVLARLPKRTRALGAIVGFDGGHRTVKVVRVRGSRAPFVIEDAFVETREGAPNAPAQAQAEITRKIREGGYLRCAAAFSLADESVETHGFRLPKLEAEELDSAIAWELKKTIASPDFVYNDVLRFPTPTGVEVECVIVSREVVNALHKSGEEYGVNPTYLETESSALLACARAIRGEPPHRLAIIDLGYSSFRLVFIHQGRVSLTRSLYFGLGTLIGEPEPETPATGSERGIQEGLYNLCEEFRRSEFYGKDKKGLEEIEEVLLCGGGAVLAPVRAYLEEHLADKKVAVLDPFLGAAKLPLTVTKESGPLWAVAVGLAVREAA
jgi:Tfp pilus assembly PilM family ATPase